MTLVCRINSLLVLFMGFVDNKENLQYFRPHPLMHVLLIFFCILRRNSLKAQISEENRTFRVTHWTHCLVFCSSSRHSFQKRLEKPNLTAANSDCHGEAEAPLYPSAELLYMRDFTLSP